MTGFGKGESIGDFYTLIVEIKSVNHRFKDFRFKMPPLFNAMELELKKILELSILRGSVDIFVSYKKDQNKVESLEVDFDKIERFIASIQATIDKVGVELTIQPTEFLRSDFVKENTTKDLELLDLLKPAFEQALSDLLLSRQEEGDNLVKKLILHQKDYQQYFNEVEKLKNSYQEVVKAKLLDRFEKFAHETSIDEPRFLQEIIYYLEKLDIEEEITRINIHLDKLTNMLSQVENENYEIGRQLEFLLQELNRETNTIGSKSQNSKISESVVQMKVQLEKIREQALNLQ